MSLLFALIAHFLVTLARIVRPGVWSQSQPNQIKHLCLFKT